MNATGVLDYVNTEESGFILPTHTTFVASSSLAGAVFAGAIGSKLGIDGVEMVYE